METIYITKKINDDDREFNKLEKKLDQIEENYFYDDIEYPIKLVFEEGIEKINKKIIDNEILSRYVIEVVYPNSLIEMPYYAFENAEKITLPNNLKEIFSWNLCGDSLRDINLHNVEVIDAGAFYLKINLNTICIYPCMKKIEWCAFEDANIKRLIFF